MRLPAFTFIDKVAAVFSFLVLLVLLSPLAVSFLLEQDIESKILQLNKQGLTVEILSYERGWFESKINAKMQVPNIPFAIFSEHKVIHGPMYFGALNKGHSIFLKTNIHSTFAWKVLDLSNSGAAQPIKFLLADSIFDFNGDAFIYLDRISTDISSKNDVDQAGIGSISFKNSNQYVEAIFEQPVIDLQNEIGLPIKFSGMQLYADTKIGANKLPYGRINLLCDNLNYAADNNVLIDNLKLEFVATENANKTNWQWILQAKEAYFFNQSYQKVELDLIIRNLHFDKMREVASITSNELSKPLEQTLSNWLAVLPELLQEIELEVSRLQLDTDIGEIHGWARLFLSEFDKDMPPHPIFMLSALGIEAELSVSELMTKRLFEQHGMTMFRKSEDYNEEIDNLPVDILELRAKEYGLQKLSVLEQQKFIELHDQKYLTSLTMTDGQLFVNEQVFNFLEFVSPD